MSSEVRVNIDRKAGIAIKKNGKYLLVLGKDWDGNPIKWGFPKGCIQSVNGVIEDVKIAAVRELSEETGIIVDPSILNEKMVYHGDNTIFLVDADVYSAQVIIPSKFKDNSEVVECKWYTKSQIRNIMHNTNITVKTMVRGNYWF